MGNNQNGLSDKQQRKLPKQQKNVDRNSQKVTVENQREYIPGYQQGYVQGNAQGGSNTTGGEKKKSFAMRAMVITLSIIAVMLTATFSVMMIRNFSNQDNQKDNEKILVQKNGGQESGSSSHGTDLKSEKKNEEENKDADKEKENEKNDSGEKNVTEVEEEIPVIPSVNVGDHIYFGNYEQDNNYANGKEDIEWIVLEKKNDCALIISKYAIDCVQYNYMCASVTWENSSVRTWLNGEFFNNAFNETEKEFVMTKETYADGNPDHSFNQGNSTWDNVFLLSVYEAGQYFDSDYKRRCMPTYYAEARGAISESDGGCWWWLRTIGGTQDCAVVVRNDGNIRNYGNCVATATYAVRPAVWINLSK